MFIVCLLPRYILKLKHGRSNSDKRVVSPCTAFSGGKGKNGWRVESRRKSGRVAENSLSVQPFGHACLCLPFWFENSAKHGETEQKDPGPKSELAEYEEQGEFSEDR